MRTEQRPPFILLACFVLLALFAGCEEKPGFIGRNLLPSSDDFVVGFDSLEVTYGYTRYADSLRVAFKDIYLLGNITSPFFGYSSAGIASTISTSTTTSGFGPNAHADSVILFLKWREF